METVGSVVLVVVTAAVGIGAVAALVQLWRHQPVHEDGPGGHFPDDQDDPDDEFDDEETVALRPDDGADTADDEVEDDTDEDDDTNEDEAPTRVLGRRP